MNIDFENKDHGITSDQNQKGELLASNQTEPNEEPTDDSCGSYSEPLKITSPLYINTENEDHGLASVQDQEDVCIASNQTETNDNMMDDLNDSQSAANQDGSYDEWEDFPVPPLIIKPVDSECEGLEEIKRIAQKRILVERSLAIELSRFLNKRRKIGECYHPSYWFCLQQVEDSN